MKALLFEANAQVKNIDPEMFHLGSLDATRLQQSIQLYRLLGLAPSSNALDVSTLIYAQNAKKSSNNSSLPISLRYTDEEQAYIDSSPTIRYVFDPDWAPFEWKNEIGKHEGIIADILSLIQKKSGLTFQAVLTDSWQESVDYAKSRQADMYSGLGETKARSEYMTFAERVMYTVPYVVVGKKPSASATLQKRFSTGLVTAAELQEDTIGVINNYTSHSLLKARAPHLALTPVKNIEEGLKKVLSGDLDFFIVNDQTVREHLYRAEYQELGVVSKLKGYNLELKFAVRNDWPLTALSVLNKALGKITETELNTIHQKWRATKPKDAIEQVRVSNSFVAAIQYVGVFILVAIIILFFYWLAKGRPREFSIKHTLAIVFTVLIALVLITGLLVGNLLLMNENTSEIEERQEQSISLVAELKQSSDDLTKMVQLYVTSKDDRYLQYFKEILAVRSGELAHPANATPTYWSQIVAGLRHVDHLGLRYSFTDKMTELNFTEGEVALFEESLFESTDLVTIEAQAIHLIQNLQPLTERSSLNSARSLVFGTDYLYAKSKVMAPIETLVDTLNKRFIDMKNTNARKKYVVLSVISMTILVMTLFTIFAFRLLSRRIVIPLSMFVKRADAIEQGDYSQKINIQANDEMSNLADAFNGMTEGILSRARLLEDRRKFNQSILDSQEQMVITTNCKGLKKL